MRVGRILALGLLAIGLAASLLATGGYAVYLRSAAYRESCAAMLSARLGLPSAIGQVVPRSRTAREFRGIRVWLPERRGLAAMFDSAVLTRRPRADDPEAYDLDLVGGTLELSARTWLHSDYRSVLESGLRPGFAPDGPHRVTFRALHVTFELDGLRAALHDASGQVDFIGADEGHASVVCYTFNEHQSVRPVTLRADFSPRTTGVQLDNVEIVVPVLPIAVLKLGELVGVHVRTGVFSGRLAYSEVGGNEVLTLVGGLRDLHLGELTEGILPTPWSGRATELQLDELIVQRRRVERARFHGRLEDVQLGDLLAPWGLGDAGGALRINIREAELSPRGIERLILTAQCDALALESLSRAVGWGRVTGTARLAVTDLTIVQNRLESLNAEFRTLPPAEGAAPNAIDMSVLNEAVRRAFGFALPAFLPPRVEYTDFGVRLEARDELLNVFGTHGPGGKIILTAQVGGQALPLVPEPVQPIDLKPQLDILRTQLAAQLAPPWPPPIAVEPWILWLQQRWPQLVPPALTTQPEGP
jgi:hypothetical protein